MTSIREYKELSLRQIREEVVPQDFNRLHYITPASNDQGGYLDPTRERTNVLGNPPQRPLRARLIAAAGERIGYDLLSECRRERGRGEHRVASPDDRLGGVVCV